MTEAYLWRFLVVGYLLGVVLETPILLLLLSRSHSFRRRVAAGFWLTACSYPIIVLVLPVLFNPATNGLLYTIVAETVAPVMEAILFHLAFRTTQGESSVKRRQQIIQDSGAILVANLFSFGVGLLIFKSDWGQEFLRWLHSL